MIAFDSLIEEAMKLERTVEKSNSMEGEFMSAEQLKHEECSMEASSSQMATELKYQQRDIVVAAQILVQMASEDSGLLCHRSYSHGVKDSMKGKPRMRWETKVDSHSEVARRKAKFVVKRQQEAVGGQMNAADSVVLALSAMPCFGKRKHKKVNNSYEMGGYINGHGITNRWGNKSNNHQESFEACIVNSRGRLGVFREENVHVAGPVNIPRHMENDVREENDDNLHEMWQVLDNHEIADRWGNNDQKALGAGVEDPHDRLGLLSIRKQKSLPKSYLKIDAEDVAPPVKMPFKLAVPAVERLHPVGSRPAPPQVLMTPTLSKSRRFKGMCRRRNIATINPSSEEVRAHFRKEEALRYLVPDRGFRYTALDGRKSAVAPLRKRNKVCLDHTKLKADRPRVVSIHCLVRDAAARLPGGMGTRADICTLMRDSQYLLEDVTDEQLNHFASKGLDRLHYEVDPCVKYDGTVWVYLHRNRREEDFDKDATFCTVYLRRKS